MRTNILSANIATRKTSIAPSPKLIIGKENAKGTGRVCGSFVITGTYAPTALPVAAKIIDNGAASVINDRYPSM